MKTDQKTIFITMLRGSLIRNFFRAGLISKLLDRGMRVVILTPNWKDEELFGEFAHPNLFLEPINTNTRKRFTRVLEEFYKGASFNDTVHILYTHRFTGEKNPSKILYPVRMIFMAPLSFFSFAKPLLRWVDFVLNPEREHDYLFKKYKPDVVFNTASRGDYGVLKSARRFRIPSIDMPKSWDNLSKMLFNTKGNYMIVWSPFMKEQAMRLQGYKPEEVVVAGIPQQDVYKHTDRLLSRKDFCARFGFDPEKKIILYGSMGGNSCDEPKFLDIIKRFVDERKLQNVQVLVRPHIGYAGDKERFLRVNEYSGFVVDETDKQSDKFKDRWDTSENHIYHLFNSLYHADVCVNIASTLTFDATAVGRPVINIAFDPGDVMPPYTPTPLWYKTDYKKAFTEVGGTWHVKNEEELLGALTDTLERGMKKEEGMKKIVDRFMYKNDGRASERIAEFLIKLAQYRN